MRPVRVDQAPAPVAPEVRDVMAWATAARERAKPRW
jgi:hypothetical protein